jgi:hypothetical protein
MTIDRGFVEHNDRERARLQALVTRLSDADLARPLPAGWTVAAVLGHLAFWDQRALLLLDTWEQKGIAPPPHHETDTDWINDAGKPFLLAMPPRKLADLTLSIAEAVDRRIARMSDDLVARNAAAGSPVNLLRAEHRREHLDQIDAALR